MKTLSPLLVFLIFPICIFSQTDNIKTLKESESRLIKKQSINGVVMYPDFMDVPLRETPEMGSRLITMISNHDSVLVFEQINNYSKVIYGKYTGYASTRLLSGKSSYNAGKDRLNRQNNLNYKGSFTPAYSTPSTNTNRSYQKKSSKCDTVQCSGTTKKGARCKNRTTNCSGRCHLH